MGYLKNTDSQSYAEEDVQHCLKARNKDVFKSDMLLFRY